MAGLPRTQAKAVGVSAVTLLPLPPVTPRPELSVKFTPGVNHIM